MSEPTFIREAKQQVADSIKRIGKFPVKLVLPEFRRSQLIEFSRERHRYAMAASGIAMTDEHFMALLHNYFTVPVEFVKGIKEPRAVDAECVPDWSAPSSGDYPLYGTLMIDGPAAGKMWLYHTSNEVPKSIKLNDATYIPLMATQEFVDKELKKAGFKFPVGPVYLYVESKPGPRVTIYPG